jgi:hypothetical protein
MAKAARRIDWDELGPTEFAENAPSDNRQLGSLEHLFGLIDQNRSVHFAVTAQIAGRASPYDWRKALDLLQARHPSRAKALCVLAGLSRGTSSTVVVNRWN